MNFSYDSSGAVRKIEYFKNSATNGNGEVYYPFYNLQGDVAALLDENGNIAVEYLYDAWGQVLSVTDGTGKKIGETDTTHIGNQNPFRYRGAYGYYYDVETGFYYLQSRYYDPEVGRFINGDGYASTGQFFGENMFTYCGNDPVNNSDPTGYVAGVDDAVIALGVGIIFIFGSIAIVAVGQSQSKNAEIPSISLGDLLFNLPLVLDPLSWPIYLAAEHTKRNGSKKKTNDKHTKPRPGRESEKKKQKKGWKPRNGGSGLFIDHDWVYDNNLGEVYWDYEDVPDGYFRCTNPLHNACLGYHTMIL